MIIFAELAKQWNISKRRIQVLCREGRIDGAKMIGNMWVIPKDSRRPEDARFKTPVESKSSEISTVRRDLKKLLKDLFKMADEKKYLRTIKEILFYLSLHIHYAQPS